MRTFNTAAVCIPELHYMVDLTGRLEDIKKMVDAGQYFTINRARQYGKTTTLKALAKYLAGQYLVISLDFQRMSYASFQTEGSFSQALVRSLLDEGEFSQLPIPQTVLDALEKLNSVDSEKVKLDELFRLFSRWCLKSEKPIVLMIDEIDSAANNQVFLDFLAQLRVNYIDRATRPAFWSVILSGVTDVKNLKRKLRSEEGRKYNSPWNIAADFRVIMSFFPADVAGMLMEYEADHHTGMEIDAVAQCICDYTSGYPFLVSRICQLIDTQLMQDERFDSARDVWSENGVSEAVRLILMEKNTLFESLMGKVQENKELNEVLKTILFAGESISYNPDDPAVSDAEMYGFVKCCGGTVQVANRIFETRLYNFYLGAFEVKNEAISAAGANEKHQFITDGRLNMERVLERFIVDFDDIYGDKYEPFDEAEGRRRFLLFIRPIINGTGNYYIEPETRNNKRMDIVVDYLGERYVVELKIWRGHAYNERGEQQLAEYLEHYHLTRGYMLSYNFNKNKNRGIHRHLTAGKELIEAVV